MLTVFWGKDGCSFRGRRPKENLPNNESLKESVNKRPESRRLPDNESTEILLRGGGHHLVFYNEGSKIINEEKIIGIDGDEYLDVTHE